jgi:hypothetical protein
VRGDNAFGNDSMMKALEKREQLYLFKLKLSKNVKRLTNSNHAKSPCHMCTIAQTGAAQ